MAGIKLVALLSSIVTSTRELYQELKFASVRHAALETQVDSTKKTIEFAANALSDIIDRCPDTILGHVVDAAQLRSLLRDCVLHVEKAKEILWKCQVANVRGRLRFVLKKADIQAILQDLNPVALWLCVNLSCVIVGLVHRFSKAAASGVPMGPEQMLLIHAFSGKDYIEDQLKAAMKSVAELMGADGSTTRKVPTLQKEAKQREPGRGIRRRLSKSHRPQETLLRRPGKQAKAGYGFLRRMSLTERKAGLRSASADALIEKKKDQQAPTGWSIRRIPTAARMKKGLKLPQQANGMTAERSPSRYVSLPTPDLTDSDAGTRNGGALNPSMLRPPPAVPTPPSNCGSRRSKFMSGALGGGLDSRSSISLQPNQLQKVSPDVLGNKPVLKVWPRSKSSSGTGTMESSSGEGGAALAPSSGEITPLNTSHSDVGQLAKGSQRSTKSSTTSSEKSIEDEGANERPEDFLDAFARMAAQNQTSNDGKAIDKEKQPNWAPGTWIGLAGWVDASWAFLFYQKQDGWVQLALVPDDYGRSAVLLEPIIQVPIDSPMHCEVTRGYHGRTVVRLFIFLKDDEQSCSLVECRLDFGKGLETGQLPCWAMERFEIQPSSAGGQQVDDLITWDTGMSILLAASAEGGVVSVYERTSLTGNWDSIPYPEKIPVEPGDYIFHTELPGGHKVRLRKLNQEGITQYEVNGYESWRDLHEEHPVSARLDVLNKEVKWHRHPPKRSPGSCRVIHNSNGTVAGIFCQTEDDDIYLFRGHPWWNDLHSPEFVCSVQPGSKFVVSESRRVLIFISRENEMKRVDFGLDAGGEVSIETVSSLFLENHFSTTLGDLLLKSPIDDYLQYRPLYQGSSADYYDTSSSSSSSSERREPEYGAENSTWSSFRSSPFGDPSPSWLGLPESESAPLLPIQQAP
ncbi:hypothetical protein jhhlp_001601 [Lomentospora prolificans]|uniref:Uncharacterized protein n=1 Tax=Lomentospora prolificans TaxID=41688 RepID=A0A2N3NIR3_9PEZI|nr:hypothetical protein jhhlp_001601 [Lomentospora prolificans]